MRVYLTSVTLPSGSAVRPYQQVPLEALSSQLHGYLAVLKGKLVEVINEDYNDFVSLSTKLVNVDGAVAQMQKPLLVLKVRLQHADDVHTSSMQWQ